MAQTILDEYLAAITVDDDELLSNEDLPDPKPYGFDSIAAMLVEAQDTMMELGETISILKRKLAEVNKEILPQRGDKDSCPECGRGIMFVAGSWSHIGWPPGIKPDNCTLLHPK